MSSDTLPVCHCRPLSPDAGEKVRKSAELNPLKIPAWCFHLRSPNRNFLNLAGSYPHTGVEML